MIEVCCGSFEDAMMASECGIKRVELNSALSLGGLTPSLGSLIMIKQYSDIEIVSMVRARAGGFCYTNYQYEQMLENLKLLLAYGTDGVSFGFLNEDRTIDKNRCQEFLENVKNEGRKATFHRAFDCTRDPYEAIETLIDLGFKQRPEDHRQNRNQTSSQHMQRLGSRCNWNGRESIISGIR